MCVSTLQIMKYLMIIIIKDILSIYSGVNEKVH